MRIVVHGQQAFGKAVLEALLKRGENVVAVYVAPEKEGAKADPLKEAALAAKLPVYQPASYKDPKVWEEFKALKPDLQVMAFVTLFVPEDFLNIPTHGSIQYHPSLLPAYRGASRHQLADHQGREGNRAVDLLARQRARYRRHPGAEENADLRHRHARHRLFRPPVPDGRRSDAGRRRPGESRQGAAHQAGRIRRPPMKAAAAPSNAKIDWGKPWEQIDRLIRGCNPAPGAWTTFDGKQLKIFDAKPLPAKDPKGIAGKLGEIVAVEADGFTVVCADGRFKVTRVQPDGGKKIDAGEFIATAKARRRSAASRLTAFRFSQLNGSYSHARLAASKSEVRHRNFAGRQEAADPRRRQGKARHRRRKTSIPTATTRPRCRWTSSSPCKASRTAS